jgi:hypothetical protein
MPGFIDTPCEPASEAVSATRALIAITPCRAASVCR